MKTNTTLILIILTAFALTQCKQNPQPVVYQQQAQPQQDQPQPQIIPDTVVLTMTPRQEEMMSNIQSQINQLTSQRDVIFELVLETNNKTRRDLEGKAIKTVSRK